MKQFLITLLIMSGLMMTQQAYAVDPSVGLGNTTYGATVNVTVNDFIAMDLKAYRDAEGKKLNWGKRILLRGAQKHFAKQVKKGKLEGTADFHQAAADVNRGNRTGRMSLIFSSLGLVFLFIPPLALIGFLLGTAGFILGIIGLSRDDDATMAIIGTVIGGIIVLIFLLAVAIVASWGRWF